MTDISRRKALALLGTSVTALGSGCTSLLDSPSGDEANGTRPNSPKNGTNQPHARKNKGNRSHSRKQTTNRSRSRKNETEQSRPRKKNTGQLVYPNDVRKLAMTSGKPLSAVSGLGSWVVPTTDESATATTGSNTTAGSNATVGTNTTAGSNATVGTNTTVGSNATVGTNTTVGSNATVGTNTTSGVDITDTSVTTIKWHGPGGNTGVRLVSPPKSTGTSMRTTFEKPLDLTNKSLSLGINLDRPANETVVIRLHAPDERNVLEMERYLSRRTGTVRLDIAPGKTVGSPDPSDVRGMTVAVYTKSDEALDLRVGAPRIRKLPQRQRGAVILTFDDNYHSVLGTGKPIMDKFGYSGVVGIIPWTVGEEDRLTRKQLHAMASEGWEMSSHPHPPRSTKSLPELPKKRQRAIIERSKRWLLEEGFATGAQTLIWPYGRFGEQTLDFVGRYHRLAFGGGTTPAPWAITEAGWIPRANGDNPKEVRHAVDMAARFGTVTTVMYHTIGKKPRISTKAFRNELRYIDRADVDVILPSELASAQPY